MKLGVESFFYKQACWIKPSIRWHIKEARAPNKIFKEIRFIANFITSYTPCQFNFNTKNSLNSKILKKSSIGNINLNKVDFQNIPHPNL